MSLEIMEQDNTYRIIQENNTITISQQELIELYYEINEIILNNEKLWDKTR